MSIWHLRKEKLCSVVGYEPILPEADGAGGREMVVVENAAHTQGVIRLVLRSIWNFIVVRAELFQPTADRFIGEVVGRKAEY